MTSAVAILEKLADASPVIDEAWSTSTTGGEDHDLPYVAAGRLARIVLEVSRSDAAAVEPVLRAAELTLEDGSPEDRNLVIVGFLESIQNLIINSGGSLDEWKPRMGPEVSAAWQALQDVWQARISATAFNAIVDGSRRV